MFPLVFFYLLFLYKLATLHLVPYCSHVIVIYKRCVEPPMAPVPSEKANKARKALPTGDKRKKKKKKRTDSFGIYIYKVLKELHHDRSISVRAMFIMDSFVHDCFHRIASEASRLVHYNNRSTLTSSDIQTALRIVLPGELAKHATSEGIKALMKYERSSK